jgi:hypothetical protein
VPTRRARPLLDRQRTQQRFLPHGRNPGVAPIPMALISSGASASWIARVIINDDAQPGKLPSDAVRCRKFPRGARRIASRTRLEPARLWHCRADLLNQIGRLNDQLVPGKIGQIGRGHRPHPHRPGARRALAACYLPHSGGRRAGCDRNRGRLRLRRMPPLGRLPAPLDPFSKPVPRSVASETSPR